MLLLTGTERVSRASWAHSASSHLSAASMHAQRGQTPDRHSNACPPSGCSGRIRTVHAGMVHRLLALPHSPLQGSPASNGSEDPRSRLESGGAAVAAIHATSARPGQAHQQDMPSMAPRTEHGVPEPENLGSGSCGAALAACRCAGVSSCCVGETRYRSAGGWEGR